MRRVGFSTGVVAMALLLSCAEPPPPATPPSPTSTLDKTPTPAPAPTAEAVPSAGAASSAAPAPPAPVARKECPKVSAMAPADEPFWHVLAQPGSCWSLAPAEGAATNDIVIEAYDVHQVGDADVARLRVSYNGPNGPEDLGDRDPWPQLVAVTKKGVYFFDRKADDKTIGAALAKAPTHPDPPRYVEANKANKWRMVHKGKSPKGEVACFGWEMPKGECADACAASICVAHTGGLVSASGAATPGGGTYAQRGVRIEMNEKIDDAKKAPAKK